jgi:hypothetical protein
MFMAARLLQQLKDRPEGPLLLLPKHLCTTPRAVCLKAARSDTEQAA